MSHSEELRAKVRLAEPGLLEVSEHFWTHPQMADMFPEYLFMMHSIIRSSVSLINSAAEVGGRARAPRICCAGKSRTTTGRMRWKRRSTMSGCWMI